MTPKIADFGIARVWLPGQTMVYTSSVIGLVHYLSPEQAGGCPVTARSPASVHRIVFAKCRRDTRAF